MKLGGRFQRSDHDRELDDETETTSPAAVSRNALHGQINLPGESDNEEESGAATSVNWGKGARRRQKRMIKEITEAEAKRKAIEEEADSDQEIEEFLRNAID